MSSTSIEPDSSSDEAAGRPAEGLVSAPLAPRLLAALVDYLVVTALLLASSQLVPYSDWQFLIPLVCGAFYLGIGNSEATSGQTLGKRVFGLQTLRITSGEKESEIQLGFLPVFRSVFRYFLSFGILILVSELPPLLYRAYEFHASSHLLELHMIMVLAYFFADIFYALVHPTHRSLHDIFSGSIVTRGAFSEYQTLRTSTLFAPNSLTKTSGIIILSILLSSGLWLMGGVHNPTVATIGEQRYVLENRFPIRILAIDHGDRSVELHCLILQNNQEELDKTIEEVRQFLIPHFEREPKETRIEKLIFTVFLPEDPSASQRRIEYSLNE